MIGVTGSSGAIGHYMSTSVLPLRTRLESSRAEMVRELESAPEKITSLIHLAAMTLVSDCEKDPARARALNVDGAEKWLSAAAEAGVKHFVFASTSHVYGRPTDRTPLTPDHPTGPVNIYGQTKLEAERRLQQLAMSFPDMKLTIVRLFSVLSDYDRPGYLLTNLRRRAREKDFSPIPGLRYTRDFIDGKEAASRLLRLARWQEAPSIVQICSGQGRTVFELASQVFAEFGEDPAKLVEAPRSPGDVEWTVGVPTRIP